MSTTRSVREARRARAPLSTLSSRSKVSSKARTGIDAKEQYANITASQMAKRGVAKKVNPLKRKAPSSSISMPASKKAKFDDASRQKLMLEKKALQKKLDQQDRMEISDLLKQIQTLQSSMEELKAEHDKEKERMVKASEKRVADTKDLQQCKFTAMDRERARLLEKLTNENKELKDSMVDRDDSLETEVQSLREQVSQLESLVQKKDEKIKEQQSVIHKLLGFCAAAKSKLRIFKKTKKQLNDAEDKANHFDVLLSGAMGDLEDTKAMLKKAQRLLELEQEKHLDELAALEAKRETEFQEQAERHERQLQVLRQAVSDAEEKVRVIELARAEGEEKKTRASGTLNHQRKVLNTAIGRLKKAEAEKKALEFNHEVLQMQMTEQRNKYMTMLQAAGQQLREEQQKREEDNEQWKKIMENQVAELGKKLARQKK